MRVHAPFFIGMRDPDSARSRIINDFNGMDGGRDRD